MRQYILNPGIALRGWRLVPYAYYIQGVRDAKGMKKDEFELLLRCDGTEERALAALRLCVENGFTGWSQTNVHRLNIQAMLICFYTTFSGEPIYEKPRVKNANLSMFFCEIFSHFSKGRLQQGFLKIQSFQWIQSETGSLFDKKVRKTAPLRSFPTHISLTQESM